MADVVGAQLSRLALSDPACLSTTPESRLGLPARSPVQAVRGLLATAGVRVAREGQRAKRRTARDDLESGG